MQFLSPVRTPADLDAREVSAGSRLPYARHVDDVTLQTRDGLLLQVIRLEGFLFETADTDELNYRQILREAVLQAIASTRFAVYHHIVRRRVDALTQADFPDAFSARLDEAWRARLSQKRLYANALYLTLVRRPSGRPRGLGFGRLGGRNHAPPPAPAETLRDLGQASEQLLAALAPYGARRLSAYDAAGGPGSEVLEFLSTLYNDEERPVRLPQGDLGQYLPYRRVSFGLDAAGLSASGHGGKRFVGMVSVKDYPGQTTPGMLDGLMRLPFEFTVSQSFAFVDRGPGLERMNLALRRMQAADDEARSLRDELALAKDDLAAGRSAFGEHHMTIAIHAGTLAEIDEGAAEIQAALTELGLVAVREELGLEPAFWAQFPGNFRFITRRALISTSNFASFASSHNFALGKPAGNHWGAAVTALETTAAGPYHFNFHQGDLGNFTIIGPSGSGKTVVLNFLLAQAQKYRPRTIFFDKDRGAELFIRAIGGRYAVLRPGTPSGLNPLQLPQTPQNRRFLIDWAGRLLSGPGQVLSSDESRIIDEAVAANFTAAPAHRRLRHFAQLLRGERRPHGEDLWARSRPWWGPGEHAWLFDNPHDETGLESPAVGFDMTMLLDEPTLRTPAMMYLFHRVEERLDGDPTLIVIDEGWKALDDDVFVARIRDWEKTIRKRNGVVGFATQSAEDALQSRIASAIVEQAATQIFMANPKAQARDYVEGFGLTQHEFDLVRSLPDASRCFLIKHGRDSVVARLNLSGENDLLTVLSGRERTVRLLDEIRALVGDDPAAWLPQLLKVA